MESCCLFDTFCNMQAPVHYSPSIFVYPAAQRLPPATYMWVPSSLTSWWMTSSMLWSGSSSGMGWSPTDDRLMRCDPVCRSACNRQTHPPYTGYHHTHPPYTGYHHPPSLYRVPPPTLLTIQGTTTHTRSSPYRVPGCQSLCT